MFGSDANALSYVIEKHKKRAAEAAAAALAAGGLGLLYPEQSMADARKGNVDNRYQTVFCTLFLVKPAFVRLTLNVCWSLEQAHCPLNVLQAQSHYDIKDVHVHA